MQSRIVVCVCGCASNPDEAQFEGPAGVSSGSRGTDTAREMLADASQGLINHSRLPELLLCFLQISAYTGLKSIIGLLRFPSCV